MIWHLAVAPNSEGLAFAASSDKLYRTRDGGDTWEIVLAQGITSFDNFFNVGAVAFAATVPPTVYASNFFGLIRSTDGGSNWVSVGINSNVTVKSLAVDPLVATTVYVGTNAGVLKTLDSGESWFPVSVGLDAVSVSALAIDPVNPSTLYAADSRLSATSGTLFKSQNAGLSWSRIDEGLARMTGPESGFAVLAIAIDPTLPSTIYASKLASFACSRCTSGSGGLFRSQDAGSTWELVASSGEFDAGLIVDVAVAPTAPPTVMAAVLSIFRAGAIFVSSDAGSTWNRTALEFAGPAQSLAVDASHPGTAYAGIGPSTNAESFILKTTDAGRTWKRSERGLTSLEITALAVSPTEPRSLFAATGIGVFRTSDAGANWQPFVDPHFSPGGASQVVIDPNPPNIAYVLSGGAIFRVIDGGAWTQLNGPAFPFYARTLAIDPKVSSTLYAGADEHFGGLGPGLLRSTDGGNTWAVIGHGLPVSSINAVAFEPAPSTTMYVAPQLNKVYGSTNSGQTWTFLGAGLPNDVVALAIDPITPTILYAASSGLFRSADAGRSWIPVGGEGLRDYVSSVVIDPKSPNNVYAGTCSGAYHSADRGLTWTSLGPLPCIRTLAIDTSTSERLFAGTFAAGVWSLPLTSFARARPREARPLPPRP